MTVNEILDGIRSKLTGNTDEDIKFLEAEAEVYKNSENVDGGAVIDGITKIIYEIMPEDKKEAVRSQIYVGDKRFDEAYREASMLSHDGKINESIEITQQLYDKVMTTFRETEEAKYMCFRNPLEHQLYLSIYAVNKKLLRSPFDLSKFLLLHAYNLVELKKPAEAVEVLNDAIRFNPVNPEPYFELAECYKVLCEPTKLLNTTKETLTIVTTPYGLSRCYANLGFYCIDKKDYDSAVCFYYESLIYGPHPGVQAELTHIASITRKKIVPPIRTEVAAAFEKYNLKPGADPDVIALASALAKDAMSKENMEDDARFYLLVVYGLTRNPEVEKILNEKYGGIPDSLKGEVKIKQTK